MPVSFRSAQLSTLLELRRRLNIRRHNSTKVRNRDEPVGELVYDGFAKRQHVVHLKERTLTQVIACFRLSAICMRSIKWWILRIGRCFC